MFRQYGALSQNWETQVTVSKTTGIGKSRERVGFRIIPY